MAGCGSYSKVEGFVFLPITAFAMALTTFIGQNLGAGQFDRAKQGARIGILCSMAMAELIGVALFFLAPYAMRLFNDDPAVVAIGVRQSHIEALFFCFLAAFRFWGYEETIRLLVDENPAQLLQSFKFLWINNIWQPDSGLARVPVSRRCRR